jgi:hypothetical protein
MLRLQNQQQKTDWVMPNMAAASFMACLACFTLTIAGCDAKKTEQDKAIASLNTTGETDDHDHDHTAPEEVGPNGGHLVHLHPGHMNVEWTHDDETEEVAVFVDELIKAGNTIDEVYLNIDLGNEVAKKTLTAVDGSGPAKFAVVDPQVMATISVEEVKTQLFIVIDGVEHSGEIVCEHDDHDGHNHAGHSHGKPAAKGSDDQHDHDGHDHAEGEDHDASHADGDNHDHKSDHDEHDGHDHDDHSDDADTQ